MKTTIGKWNIGVGLWVMASFMIYGFILVYLRDFAPGKEEWIASYATGKHFEARLAHVHGNLFSLLNIVFGFLLMKLSLKDTLAKWASWLALAGLLMPLGILGEVYLGLPFYFVLIGGLSMFLATVLLGVAVVQMNKAKDG
ncbi:MAG: hypothetical protein HY863_06875 [Chloroflexi bacterium]|nr:hypothetical protein [Chloroflexota bacterium]